MFKIQVQLATLHDLGLLQKTVDRLNLKSAQEYVHLFLALDYLNNDLPKGYENYIPDLSSILELEVPIQYLQDGLNKWINN